MTSTTEQITTIEVRRDDLAATRTSSEPVPDLNEGQALLRVDRFGLTANNVTYGVIADMVGYFDFFPTEGGWGRIPVWGFAEVAASRAPGVEEGTRVFGYLPMATHLVVEPAKASPAGFTDTAGARPGLPAVYNRYRSTSADPMHSRDTEDLQAVFVPLFATSFLIDDFLADNGDFGADQVVLTSASSKTAAGTALCTARRAGPRPRIVGLTSAANVAFVEGLGCYDEVLAYEDLTSLDPSVPTALVDIAGDAAVRGAVHRHLGDQLRVSSTVGMTHWEALGADDADLPGPRPELFFAPARIEKRVGDWGADGYAERLASAWSALVEVAGDWVAFVEVDGLDAARDRYLDLLSGRAAAGEAVVVDLTGR